MSGEVGSKASDKLADYIKQVDDYINLSNTKFSSFKEEFLTLSDMSMEQLGKLSQQEAFNTAYILYSYATYIQDEVNKHTIIVNWCNDQIEKLVVMHNDEFSQYTKHEVKRQTIAQNNSYAAKIDQMRSVAESRLQSLDGKVYELKRKADILLEKGKRL